MFGGDSLGLIDGGLEVVEMIQPGGSLEAIREKYRPPMAPYVRLNPHRNYASDVFLFLVSESLIGGTIE